MRSLSALDASFIYLESDHSPMHIGGVYVMDAAGAPPGFGFAAFREHIRERLRCSRVFRERLIEAPLGLAGFQQTCFQRTRASGTEPVNDRLMIVGCHARDFFRNVRPVL